MKIALAQFKPAFLDLEQNLAREIEILDKKITPFNHVLEDRRKALYTL